MLLKAVEEKRFFPMGSDREVSSDFQLIAGTNRDPAMKKTFGGSAAGKGATYGWEGNKEVGKGDMLITESSAPNLVRMDLHFQQPFEANNQVDFKLVTEGDSTKVTWGMDGKNNMISKVMGLFINMDNMIGKDFQAGLDKLKTVAEK